MANDRQQAVVTSTRTAPFAVIRSAVAPPLSPPRRPAVRQGAVDRWLPWAFLAAGGLLVHLLSEGLTYYPVPTPGTILRQSLAEFREVREQLPAGK